MGPHLSQDKRFVELLIAEAKVLSLLKHRNIVQIFDVGLGDDGQYFLVMEYVDGKDLGAIQLALETRRKRMPFDLALHVVAEICEALEHAHNARAPDGKPMNLVHRDVSPSNVLLSLSGEVKLTDFGIAKRAEQETQAGSVRGKFAYISPEQARNEAIAPRSDVFSVGILLWELITNGRLFSGLGDLEALRAVREVKIPRLTDVDPRMTPDIEALVMSALAPDPRQRPTAGQLGAKLRSLRYSLEVTVGDPATELAKIIDTADQVQRESMQAMPQHLAPSVRLPLHPGASGGYEGNEHTEATVIRIRTADVFSIPDKQIGMAKARAVIDRFEEEETKLAQLTGEQMAQLRTGRESQDLAPPPSPRKLPGVARQPSNEGFSPTASLRQSDLFDESSPVPAAVDGFDYDESTRLRTQMRDRPPSERSRPPTPGTLVGRSGPPPRPPAIPERARAATGAPPPRASSPTAPPRAISQLNRPPATVPPGSYQAPYGVASRPATLPPPNQAPQPGYPAGPGWGVAAQLPLRGDPQTAQDIYERPVGPRLQTPPVAGFQVPRPLLQPWMLIVGAVIMALLAFVITRVLLS